MKRLLITTLIIAYAGCQPPPVQQSRSQNQTTQPQSPNTKDSIRVPRPWAIDQTTHTNDTDSDLKRVLELEKLEGACEDYRTGDRSEKTRLRCGKWMFFYEHFGTVGVPSHLLEFFQQWYQPYFGPSFSSMGFIANPNSNDSIPIGLSESTQRMGSIKVHAFTCASCHFGKMPDGRYAVGYPNHQLDYGRFFASMIALMK